MPVAVALDAAGRLAVAVALAWAAVGKLADVPRLRATLYLSRLTRPWVPQLAVLLPATELLLAAALTGARAGGAAALAAALLLAVFVAFLALDASAAQGCNCFGGRAATSRRAGIGRDLLLLAALAPAVVRGPGAARAGVAGVAEPVALVTATAAAAVLLAAASRRDRWRGASGRRRAGVPPVPSAPARRTAPEFDVPALDGGRLVLADLAARPAGVLLVFAEPGCALCEAVLPELTGRHDAVVLAGAGRAEDVADWAVALGLPPARTAADVDGALADAYQVPGVPAAARVDATGLLVDAAGAPARRLAVGPEAVRALVRAAPRSPLP